MEDKSLKVFLSYSWDNEEHQQWVINLAEKLTENGIYVILDKYDLKPGNNMTSFMEKSICNSDKVLLILTPMYKAKADSRIGGVGYEYSIVTQEFYENQSNNKFIPILRAGTPNESAPYFLKTIIYHKMIDNMSFGKDFTELLRLIYDEPEIRRLPIGKKPIFTKNNDIANNTYMHNALIEKINALNKTDIDNKIILGTSLNNALLKCIKDLESKSNENITNTEKRSIVETSFYNAFLESIVIMENIPNDKNKKTETKSEKFLDSIKQQLKLSLDLMSFGSFSAISTLSNSINKFINS